MNRRRQRIDDEAIVIGSDEEDEHLIIVEDDDDGNVLPTQLSVLPTQPVAAATGAVVGAPAARRAAVPAAAEPGQQAAAAPDSTAAAAAGNPAADADADADASADAGTCTICLDLLFEQGKHRPAALKCGHIFGDECIRQWLRHKPKCPQCNRKSQARDITLLYNLPKAVAAGAASADLQAKLQEAEASRQREKQRAAQLEAQLRDMQQQMALNQQRQQQQQQQREAALGLAANYAIGGHLKQHLQQGLPPQQQRQHHRHHQQQQLHQQNRAGLASSGPGRPYYPPPPPPPPRRQQQQQQQQDNAQLGRQVLGHKRSWEQAGLPAAIARAGAAPTAGMVQSPQPQQQAGAAAATAASPSLVNDTVANAAAEGHDSSSSSTLLTLLPVKRCSAPQQQRQLSGAFIEMQQLQLEGSRCFHLDVQGALLLVAETTSMATKLRKVSLLCPGSPSYLALPPAAGYVRGLAAQRDAGFSSSSNSSLMALATAKAGLQLVSMTSNNIVQSVPVQSPVWSVAWSTQYEHQLLLGLDRGRLAVADIRKPSGEMLVSCSSSGSSSSGGARVFQPLHRLIPLQDWQLDLALRAQQDGSSSSSRNWTADKPEVIVACTGGVYSWSRSRPDSFDLLLPTSWHGGTCESIALAPDGITLAASFRAPAAGPNSSSITPVHVMAQLGASTAANAATSAAPAMASSQPDGSAEAAGAVQMQSHGSSQTQAAAGASAAAGGGDVAIASALQAGREQLLQQTVRLSGHSSSSTMTHGCFLNQLPDLPCEQLLFASADELSHMPRLWGCSTGAELVPAYPWMAMPLPVLQVTGGYSAVTRSALLGAMCEQRFVLYQWEAAAAGC